jgi:hypothetical protein
VHLVLSGLNHDTLGQYKKFEVPKDAIAGTIKSVDLKAHTFTITRRLPASPG